MWIAFNVQGTFKYGTKSDSFFLPRKNFFYYNFSLGIKDNQKISV